MNNSIKKSKKIINSALIILILLVGITMFNNPVYAASFDSLANGVYDVEASLSCYVNAMGGVEFGKPLMIDTKLSVSDSGTRTMTLSFTKSSVTIYGITCDTFIDPNPEYVTEDRGVKSGTVGYYDKNGVLQTSGIDYTLSADTAPNPKNIEVNYIDSITFPIDYQSDTYNLTFYINSNVMGVQFCNANDKATATTYPATLTVDWETTLANVNMDDTPAAPTVENPTAEQNNPQSSNQTNSGNQNANTAQGDASQADSNGVEDTQTTASGISESSTDENESAQETAIKSASVIETKDGLNIHYASTPNDDAVIAKTVSEDISPNTGNRTQIFIILLILGGAMVIAGITLIMSAKKKGVIVNAAQAEAELIIGNELNDKEDMDKQ